LRAAGFHLVQPCEIRFQAQRERGADGFAEMRAHRHGFHDAPRRDATIARQTHLGIGPRVVQTAEQTLEDHAVGAVRRGRYPLDRRPVARQPLRPHVPYVAVVDAVDRRRADLSVPARPHLRRRAEGDHRVAQQRLQGR
jgi:hypothetical protein